ncbi:MAG: malonyl-CoA decarboxylase family protein [Pseudomonadota bacterium]
MALFTPPGFTMSDILAGLFERRQDVKARLAKLSLPELIEGLMSCVSETQQTSFARAILLRYHHGDDAIHRAFFDYLLDEMDLDAAALHAASAAYEEDPTPAAYRRVLGAAEPRRKELFRRLGSAKGGAACLVKIRDDIRRSRTARPELAKLDHDLHALLGHWFNRGFLELRPVTWDSPAQVLEKIIDYEAVHTIQDWDDLRRRVQPHDRRCYAFFHPRMPDDPIIFVEVALTQAVPDSVDTLLAQDRRPADVESLTTATFYSISNCHAGLAGISFGNVLIKKVVRELSRELPQLKTFVTLSPIPSLAAWAGEDRAEESPDRLAARYLATVKREDGLPQDPVARFHLANGAALHAVHADANTSARGQAESFGAMVNYLYEPSEVNRRSEAFAMAGRFDLGPKLRALLPRERGRRLSSERA